MRKNIVIRPHDNRSEGAKELAANLGIRRLRYQNSQFIPVKEATIINWGCSDFPAEYGICKVVNDPKRVSAAANKLLFFSTIQEARTVPWTTERSKVSEWLQEGAVVCARTLLRASGGDGLRLFDGCDIAPPAPLYTKYIKKKDEFRVHIMAGEVICIQRKALKKDFEPDDNIDHRIRNLANGYIFARNDIHCPPDVESQSILSIKEIGLDFGAVDVLWNEKKQQAFVLEINTAPGLEGTTVKDYGAAFRKLLT